MSGSAALVAGLDSSPESAPAPAPAPAPASVTGSSRASGSASSSGVPVPAPALASASSLDVPVPVPVRVPEHVSVSKKELICPQRVLLVSILVLVLGVLVGFLWLPPPPDPSLATRIDAGDWKLPQKNNHDFKFTNEKTLNLEEEVVLSFDAEHQVAGTVNGLQFVVDTRGKVFNGDGNLFSFPEKHWYNGRQTSHHTLRFPLDKNTFLTGVTILGIDEENVIRISETITFYPRDFYFLIQKKLEKFPTGLKIVIAGEQGVGKSTLVSSLLHLLFGKDYVIMYAKAQDIHVQMATTKTVTIFDKEWAALFEDNSLQKIMESGIQYVDPPGHQNNQTELFGQNFWLRIITGQHPNFYDPESKEPLDPSTFNNKTASAVLLCVDATATYENGQLGQVAKDVAAAASKAGVPVFVAITKGNKPGETVQQMKERITKDLFPAIKETAPNPLIFWTYSDANANIEADFHNLLELIKLIQMVLPRK